MQLGLINSAWSQAGISTAEGIRLTKQLGFDSIDIFADPLEIDVRERVLIRTECEKHGLPIVSVPCVAFGLIDFNPAVRKFHRNRCKAYLDFAFELGAKNLLLVLGEYVWNQEVIPPAKQWEFAVEEVAVMGDRAAELGLEIALELEPFPLSLVNTLPKMIDFMDQVNRPNVLANVDISHMHLSKSPPEELRTLKGRVAHVHISDCDGKVHGDMPPGHGVVDFPPYLKEIADLGVTGAVSIELEYAPDPGKIVEWVTESYQATAKLMQEAGLRHE